MPAVVAALAHPVLGATTPRHRRCRPALSKTKPLVRSDPVNRNRVDREQALEKAKAAA